MRNSGHQTSHWQSFNLNGQNETQKFKSSLKAASVEAKIPNLHGDLIKMMLLKKKIYSTNLDLLPQLLYLYNRNVVSCSLFQN